MPADLPAVSSERVRKVFAELERFSLASSEQIPDSMGDLRLLIGFQIPAEEDLTTQAQRPGPRGRSIATWTRWPG